MPGGFCDQGEHPGATAIREAREEAGVSVELVRLIGMWMDRYEPTVSNTTATEHVLAIYYLARLVDDELANPDPAEVSEVKWFRSDDLPKDLAFPEHLPLVLDVWREALDDGLYPPSSDGVFK